MQSRHLFRQTTNTSTNARDYVASLNVIHVRQGCHEQKPDGVIPIGYSLPKEAEHIATMSPSQSWADSSGGNRPLLSCIQPGPERGSIGFQ